MNNELIAAMEEARQRGTSVKSIRKQKHDPCNFYMTCADGKQMGPIKCEGSQQELDKKFAEAQECLQNQKPSTTKKAA